MPEQTLTTQTTASTQVARLPAEQAFNQWQIAAGIAGGVAGLLTAIAALLVIVNTIRGWQRDRSNDEDGQSAELRTEIDALAALCREFKPKSELAEDNAAIRRELGHEKAARKADSLAAAGKFRDHDAALLRLAEGQARQQALLEAFSSGVARLEGAIDRIAERFEARFADLQRLVSTKP